MRQNGMNFGAKLNSLHENNDRIANYRELKNYYKFLILDANEIIKNMQNEKILCKELAK